MPLPIKVELAEGVTLWCCDFREIIPDGVDEIDHIITDPPFEQEAHDARKVLQRPDGSKTGGALPFSGIGEMRDDLLIRAHMKCRGWLLAFCTTEGVAAWRDAIEANKLRYKRPMCWIKPNAAPQFNGQGPAIGHECIVSAWCGTGYSSWNGGGRHGIFTHYIDHESTIVTDHNVRVEWGGAGVDLTVAGDILQIRAIDGSLSPRVTTALSTLLSGRGITALFQMASSCTIKTGTNSITDSPTWNWLTHLLTKEYTGGVNYEMASGGNRAGSAARSRASEMVITLRGEVESIAGAKLAALGSQLKISVQERREIFRHPTQKPVALMVELVSLFSSPQDLICDPFMGTGSTGIAAVKLGRRFLGIEKSRKFFDVACRRIEEVLKQGDLFVTAPELKQGKLEL